MNDNLTGDVARALDHEVRLTATCPKARMVRPLRADRRSRGRRWFR